jgi:hypothetical protein
MRDTVRRGIAPAVLLMTVLGVVQPAESARQALPTPGQPARQAVPPAQVQRPVTGAPAALVGPAPVQAGDLERTLPNAEQTRDAFRRVLDHYSPNVGRVLALDPLLVQNPTYLEPYPEIAAFLQQHPEVGRNASFYLGGLAPYYEAPLDHNGRMVRMWENVGAGLAVFAAFVIVTCTLIWLIKSLVDYRRWSRLSKVQTDAHNKLLDRFSANEELLAYINSPSGKRFLESAPIMLDASTTSLGAPVRRILWAVEIGAVVACAAGGLLFARRYVPAEVGQGLSVIGVVAAALGIGFVVAATASYVISRRLGVLAPPAAPGGRDADAQPSA